MQFTTYALATLIPSLVAADRHWTKESNGLTESNLVTPTNHHCDGSNNAGKGDNGILGTAPPENCCGISNWEYVDRSQYSEALPEACESFAQLMAQNQQSYKVEGRGGIVASSGDCAFYAWSEGDETFYAGNMDLSDLIHDSIDQSQAQGLKGVLAGARLWAHYGNNGETGCEGVSSKDRVTVHWVVAKAPEHP